MGRLRQEPEAVAVATLQHPPLVGQRYLVPAVNRRCGDGVVRCFPVTGPLHADPEIAVPSLHLHYDLRFLPVGSAFARDVVAWAATPDGVLAMMVHRGKQELVALATAVLERGTRLAGLGATREVPALRPDPEKG